MEGVRPGCEPGATPSQAFRWAPGAAGDSPLVVGVSALQRQPRRHLSRPRVKRCALLALTSGMELELLLEEFRLEGGFLNELGRSSQELRSRVRF